MNAVQKLPSEHPAQLCISEAASVKVNYDDIAFSGDCGRINPLEKPLELTIICPLMGFKKTTVPHPTMSDYQCKIRLENKAPCTYKCKAINHLRGQ